MKVSNVVLGMIAMAASPFLFAELAGAGRGTSTSGVYDLIYMAGWMCTIIGLLRLEATGKNQKSKSVLHVQLVLLTIANIWNIWTIVDPGNTSAIYFILDFFWPLSNLCLLLVGIIVARKGILQGWKRYAVLVAGLWLPFSLLVMLLLGNSATSLVISGLYSTVGWALMGFLICTTPEKVHEGYIFARTA